MDASEDEDLVINGWQIYAHPCFLEQYEALGERVRKLQQGHPEEYKKKAPTKRLTAIRKLVMEDIPANPERPEYRQGKTLGPEYKHWFRAKFFQQYRLFFRYHSTEKIIVMAWVNDAGTKRAYNEKTDAYRVFRQMIETGNPPDSWSELKRTSRSKGVNTALSQHKSSPDQ